MRVQVVSKVALMVGILKWPTGKGEVSNMKLETNKAHRDPVATSNAAVFLFLFFSSMFCCVFFFFVLQFWLYNLYCVGAYKFIFEVRQPVILRFYDVLIFGDLRMQLTLIWTLPHLSLAFMIAVEVIHDY
ncbi:hypothetical protein RHGRI_035147 [Rhododendron griersonianum]|uniref:Uncharacterized protein n=1 Tax=Rhododendron griersonianum TaxID=479676 RepID=A0AAV6I6M8_9ERIC|nr:hypothetical protein RHGRI_035147 [Rhododendron griersonianum]